MLGHAPFGQFALGEFLSHVTLPVATASFAVNTQPAGMVIRLKVDTLAIVLTPQPQTFQLKMSVATASFAIAGGNVQPSLIMTVDPAVIQIAGDAGYYRDFVNWFPVTEPQGSSWQGAYKPSSGWTTAGTSISNWTVDPDMNIPPPERA